MVMEDVGGEVDVTALFMSETWAQALIWAPKHLAEPQDRPRPPILLQGDESDALVYLCSSVYMYRRF